MREAGEAGEGASKAVLSGQAEFCRCGMWQGDI
jgi:hypothetical protein